ncbi:hypothetical protein QOZ80_1BG0065210 [Eleusine coracana subsp. coracana]|nr:hypothetical protein QOZ80_1BG0065210 [Eleusine coracana subsp. coracana]
MSLTTTAATKEILFDVYGYTATKAMAAGGKHFESERFIVGGYDWVVRYYPDNGPYISVSLVLLSKPRYGGEVGVMFGCQMLNSSGEPTGIREVSSFVFTVYGEKHGFHDFALRDDLEEDYHVDDCFTLKCMVSVLKKPRSD